MKTIYLTLFLAVLLACRLENVEDKIVNNINKNCKQFPCVIKIKDVTDFDWDKMYIFDYGADIEQIKNAVGTSIPERTQFTRKLVFTKNGKVIRYEELPTDIENIVDNEVIFGDSDTYPHTKIYLAEDAVFEVQKYLQGGETYYHLKQKNSGKQ